MSIFFSEERLRTAVERLGSCRAHARLTDFFIFKRALVLSRGSAGTEHGTSSPVVTGTLSVPFTQAIDEWCRSEKSASAASDNPYFAPIGTKRDKTRGYRTAKFPSNGTSDTISRWPGRPGSPLRLVEGSKPKAYEPEPQTIDELNKFFLVRGADNNSELPRLSDLIVWWNRFEDLENQIGGNFEFSELADSFIEALDLRPAELALILNDTAEEEFTSEGPDAVLATEISLPANYLPSAPHTMPSQRSSKTSKLPESDNQVELISQYIDQRGFTFEPWQVATFIAAVKTKPFVILAGISGTGKSKLPRLVADATGSVIRTVPVRPDWHDSGELLGYVGITGEFRPGHLLQFAQEAINSPDKQHFLLLDEMNIARVEYYFAEVLSRLEERVSDVELGFTTEPFFPQLKDTPDEKWSTVGWPGNLTIIGSVNMDETTFAFSKKVLDRAFVIEFSSVDLGSLGAVTAEPDPVGDMGSAWWRPTSMKLAKHPDIDTDEVKRVVSALTSVNEVLVEGQLQVGYRVRDEVALFCLETRSYAAHFVTSESGTVDPLDIAVAMKILPRIQGSGAIVQRILEGLQFWADPSRTDSENESEGLSKTQQTGYPFTAARVELMLRRLSDTGFASYWI